MSRTKLSDLTGVEPLTETQSKLTKGSGRPLEPGIFRYDTPETDLTKDSETSRDDPDSNLEELDYGVVASD